MYFGFFRLKEKIGKNRVRRKRQTITRDTEIHFEYSKKVTGP